MLDTILKANRPYRSPPFTKNVRVAMSLFVNRIMSPTDVRAIRKAYDL